MKCPPKSQRFITLNIENEKEILHTLYVFFSNKKIANFAISVVDFYNEMEKSFAKATITSFNHTLKVAFFLCIVKCQLPARKQKWDWQKICDRGFDKRNFTNTFNIMNANKIRFKHNTLFFSISYSTE